MCQFKEALGSVSKLLLGFSLLVLQSPFLFGKPFDEKPYELSLSFNTPMDTLAALTDWGKDINYVYGITTIILVFVFFAVSIPIIMAIRKFKATDEEILRLPPPKQIHGNATLEFTWTVIPVILLLFIAVPTWEIIFKQPRVAPPGSLHVTVIGHQWWWEFQYPDLKITTANELHVPENTPVYFTITSADVIHSFWIPRWGGKVDALPGVENHLFMTSPTLSQPVKGGTHYTGQCVELCGVSHGLMRFEAVVHTKEEFERWKSVFHNPPVVASSLEKRGEEVFNQCAQCHTISGTSSDDPNKKLQPLNPPVFTQGPNLTDFGSRHLMAAGTRKNTFENFAAWVKDPQSIKPQAKMMKLGLSDDDIKAVGAYLRFSTAKEY